MQKTLFPAESRHWYFGRPCAMAALICCLLWAGPVDADAQAQEPETGGGQTVRTESPAYTEMIAAAHPLAADAGARVLAAGGSAVDAAIATQLVLNLVEPQSSGIGGGAFLLHYEAATGDLRSYDGRETAPAAATPDLFVNPDGSLPGYFEALAGGRSVGAPGLLRMLEAAHRAHGVLPWRDLFEPGHRAGGGRLRDRPAAEHAAFASTDDRPVPRCGGVLSRRRRDGEESRHTASQPGVRRHAAADRRRRERCVLPR